jgi:hypothetical protein
MCAPPAYLTKFISSNRNSNAIGDDLRNELKSLTNWASSKTTKNEAVFPNHSQVTTESMKYKKFLLKIQRSAWEVRK